MSLMIKLIEDGLMQEYAYSNKILRKTSYRGSDERRQAKSIAFINTMVLPYTPALQPGWVIQIIWVRSSGSVDAE